MNSRIQRAQISHIPQQIRFSFFITVGKYLLTFSVVAVRGEMRKDVNLLVTPFYSPKRICIFRLIIYALGILGKQL